MISKAISIALLSCAMLAHSAYSEENPSQSERARTPKELDEIRSAIRRKLSQRVSADFVDTPFEEAVEYLNSVAKVGIVYDPQIANGAKKKITLRLNDVSIDLALSWLCALAELHYEVHDRIFIRPRTPDDEVELQIYDIGGLVRTTEELGYDWFLVIGGEAELAKAKREYAEREREEKDFISTVKALNPNAWDDLTTCLIVSGSGDKLVVMQTKTVHASLAEYFAKLKAVKDAAEQKR